MMNDKKTFFILLMIVLCVPAVIASNTLSGIISGYDGELLIESRATAGNNYLSGLISAYDGELLIESYTIAGGYLLSGLISAYDGELFLLGYSALGSSNSSLSASLVSPTSNINVSKHGFFNFSASVTCSGGACGNVSAWLDPQLIGELEEKVNYSFIIFISFFLLVSIYVVILTIKHDKPTSHKLTIGLASIIILSGVFYLSGQITGLASGELVSTTAGATPFYTTDSNPQNCGNLSSGESCTKTWQVNATGTAGQTYTFFVIFNSTKVNVSAVNSSSINITIIDNITPSVTIVTPTSTGYNSNFVISSTATDNDNISRVFYRYENSSTNGTYTEMSKLDQTTYTATFDITSVSDGNYTFRILANDTYGNTNSTVNVSNVQIDDTYPSLTNPRISQSIGNIGAVFSFNVSVNDTSNTVNKVIAYVQKPDETNIYNVTMTDHNSDGTYNATWNSTGQSNGTYLIDIFANDSLGNYIEKENQLSIALSSNAKAAFVNNSVNIIANQTLRVNVTTTNSSHVTIEIKTRTNVSDTSISFSEFTSNIENSSSTVSENNTNLTAVALNKFFQINVENETNNNLTFAFINISYNETEINETGINESTLRMYKWNSSSNKWHKLGHTGVVTELNYVWGNVTSFSSFGIYGNDSETSSESSSSSSSSSSSGGGGGGGGGTVILTNTTWKKPVETEATCYDSIKNQDEVFTDCGGVCKPCEELGDKDSDVVEEKKSEKTKEQTIIDEKLEEIRPIEEKPAIISKIDIVKTWVIENKRSISYVFLFIVLVGILSVVIITNREDLYKIPLNIRKEVTRFNILRKERFERLKRYKLERERQLKRQRIELEHRKHEQARVERLRNEEHLKLRREKEKFQKLGENVRRTRNIKNVIKQFGSGIKDNISDRNKVLGERVRGLNRGILHTVGLYKTLEELKKNQELRRQKELSIKRGLIEKQKEEKEKQSEEKRKLEDERLKGLELQRLKELEEKRRDKEIRLKEEERLERIKERDISWHKRISLLKGKFNDTKQDIVKTQINIFRKVGLYKTRSDIIKEKALKEAKRREKELRERHEKALKELRKNEILERKKEKEKLRREQLGKIANSIKQFGSGIKDNISDRNKVLRDRIKTVNSGILHTVGLYKTPEEIKKIQELRKLKEFEREKQLIVNEKEDKERQREERIKELQKKRQVQLEENKRKVEKGERLKQERLRLLEEQRLMKAEEQKERHMIKEIGRTQLLEEQKKLKENKELELQRRLEQELREKESKQKEYLENKKSRGKIGEERIKRLRDNVNNLFNMFKSSKKEKLTNTKQDLKVEEKGEDRHEAKVVRDKREPTNIANIGDLFFDFEMNYSARNKIGLIKTYNKIKQEYKRLGKDKKKRYRELLENAEKLVKQR